MLEDAVRLRAQPELYLCCFRAEPGGLTLYLPLGLCEAEGPGELARVERPAGGAILYDASTAPAFYELLLSLYRGGWQGRSLKALFRARTTGSVRSAEGLRVLRPGLVAGAGLWMRLVLLQDGSLERTARLLPGLVEAGVPGATEVVGTFEMSRGAARAILGVLGSLPAQGAVLAAPDLVSDEISKALGRLAPHAQGLENGLLEESAKEVLELARRLGTRLARLHLALSGDPEAMIPLELRFGRLSERLARLDPQKLGLDPAEIAQLRGRLDRLPHLGQDWESATVCGAGLEGFVMVKGELYLTGFGPPGSGVVLEDLAALGFDLERSCYLAARGGQPSDRGELLTAALWSALLGAYRSATEGSRFLPPAALWEELLFAFRVERALDDLQRRGEDEGPPALPGRRVADSIQASGSASS